MAKVNLDIEYDFDFFVLGIASHLPDYRLGWSINKKLSIALEKSDNPIQVLQKDKRTFVYFDRFYFLDTETQLELFLIDNINAGLRFIPEVKQADYLMLIRGGNKQDLKRIQTAITQIDQVLMVFEVNVDELKSKEKLLF